MHLVCHGVVRLVSSNGCALGLPRCREVGFTQRLYDISTVVRLVSPNGYILFPRCREVGFIQRSYIISTAVRSSLPNGSSWCIIIIITITPFDVKGRVVSVPRLMMGIWYGTLLVYMVWYIVGLHGMVNRWFTWYGTSLVSMVWYIVGFYGMIHHWFIWYGT